MIIRNGYQILIQNIKIVHMKKIIYITISICILLTVISLLSIKWDLDIFMESTTPPPHDKVDLKLSIDNEIVFNDTLQRNPFSFPTHIKYPVRVGFHTISLSSKKANLQIEKEFFIFFNHHIAMYYGYDTTNRESGIDIVKGTGEFAYE